MTKVMKAKKRKSPICHNCGHNLLEDFNYCPNCGQSNTDNNITFSTLVREFLDNYFGIDSKMVHSFVPFLFQPGKLTNRFQAGQIKHFIHPIRLYLVASLFYFFTISYLLSGISFSSLEGQAEYKGLTDIEELIDDDRLKLLSDSVKMSLLADSLKAQFSGIEGFDALFDSLTSRYGSDFGEDYQVSIDDVPVPTSQDEPTFERLHRLARDNRISDKAFMDSLGGNSNMDFLGAENTAHAEQQVRKIFRNDEGFKGFVLGNLPLMMFLLIPLFAGVLKLIYVRRKHLYIKHIVHALHVHSFAYIAFGLTLLIVFKLIDSEAWRGIITGVSFILVSTYVYISFLKVYQQGWFKTLIKFNMVGIVYGILLLIFFNIEVFISFWYY